MLILGHNFITTNYVVLFYLSIANLIVTRRDAMLIRLIEYNLDEAVEVTIY